MTGRLGKRNLGRVSNAVGRQEFTAGQFGYVQNAASPPVTKLQPVQVAMPTTISQNNTRGNTVGTGGNAACAIGN